MAFFGINRKKSAQGGSASGRNTEETNPAPRKATQDKSPALQSLGEAGGLAHVLKNPRITEKATMHSEAGVYTFDIAKGATKREVLQAVRMLYKVSPRKVRVVSVPTKEKRNMRTGKYGVKGGGKKAYVYLKKGETLSIL